jgi:glycosyltransferase involved in cell wall biosynthesis
MARRLKTELGCAIACMLQGEDAFLDGLPPDYQQQCWRTVSQRAAEADLLIAPSHYFARRMADRLRLPVERIRVAWNGVQLQGFDPAPQPPAPPALGYFARMCRDKGLDTVVDAFIILRRKLAQQPVRLRIGGSCGPSDEPFVDEQKRKLADAGLADAADFHPNLTRQQKINFLKSVTWFSVPARYGESFGLYLVEAFAAGVPVIQPHTASYPEIIQASGAGVLFPPENPQALAEVLESLIADAQKTRDLSAAARDAAKRLFSAEAMANSLLNLFESALTPIRVSPAAA